MALGKDTFTFGSNAVSDIFGGIADIENADLKAKGLNISAEGTRLKAMGDRAEAENYDRASTLALQNERFTEQSTAIQQAQLERNTVMQIGGQRADIAGAGFTESGSGLDILADSARQGALAKAVLGQQGLITEAGYQEQADSYTTMASTARATATGEDQIANETDQLADKTKVAGTIGAIGQGIGAALNIAAMFAV